MKAITKNWPLHVSLLAVVVICEVINTITIKTPVGNILLLPMLFAMAFGLILFLLKPVKCVKSEQAHLSSSFVVIGIGIFLAKVAVNSGANTPGAGKSGDHYSGASHRPASWLWP